MPRCSHDLSGTFEIIGSTILNQHLHLTVPATHFARDEYNRVGDPIGHF